MSFLSALRERKNKLKETETIVTKADGQKFIEKANIGTVKVLDTTYGFVVDTKPDNIPVEIVNHLYIGSQDCTASDVLQTYRIECIVSIGINVEIKVSHKYVKCLDLPETDINPVLNECLPYIHNAVEAKKNILVHCNAGVSRTSMVAIAYLMKYKNMLYEDAYNFVKIKRPAIQPNAGFQRQLKSMQQIDQSVIC
jgi:protein tyrosine phosphatase